MKIANLLKQIVVEEGIPKYIHATTLLPGVTGVSGVSGVPAGDEKPLGIDRIIMEAGTEFPQHTHPGAHIIYVLEGKGSITIGGEIYWTSPGDCYFVPADIPHSVGALERHIILAIGYPHKAIEDPERMEVV